MVFFCVVPFFSHNQYLSTSLEQICVHLLLVRLQRCCSPLQIPFATSRKFLIFLFKWLVRPSNAVVQNFSIIEDAFRRSECIAMHILAYVHPPHLHLIFQKPVFLFFVQFLNLTFMLCKRFKKGSGAVVRSKRNVSIKFYVSVNFYNLQINIHGF